jgi:hypothetical protein
MAKDHKQNRADAAAGDPQSIGTDAAGDEILEHPVAAKLRGDPGQHQQLVTLAGYLGKSTIKDHVRLYLHHDFQAYYEIPEKQIQHYWPPITPGSTEPGHVAIDAEHEPHLVVHTKVSSAAAALLTGPLVTAHLAQAIETVAAATITEKTTPPPPPPGPYRPTGRNRDGEKSPE